MPLQENKIAKTNKTKANERGKNIFQHKRIN
jgi:hypothetical protein